MHYKIMLMNTGMALLCPVHYREIEGSYMYFRYLYSVLYCFVHSRRHWCRGVAQSKNYTPEIIIALGIGTLCLCSLTIGTLTS